MKAQRLDQMNDLWQDRLLDAYERQQEREYEEMVNEEPSDEGIEEFLYYREDPYTTK